MIINYKKLKQENFKLKEEINKSRVIDFVKCLDSEQIIDLEYCGAKLTNIYVGDMFSLFKPLLFRLIKSVSFNNGVITIEVCGEGKKCIIGKGVQIREISILTDYDFLESLYEETLKDKIY